jgi:alanyl-tRNA synthetase
VFPAENAFFLADTLGFPLDLTQLIVEEKGWTIDMSGFEELMSLQREKSRGTGKLLGNTQDKVSGEGDESIVPSFSLGVEELADLQRRGIPATQDYEKYLLTFPTPPCARIQAIVLPPATPSSSSNVEYIGLILDKTPFYAEAGGQVADRGYLEITQCNSSVSHHLPIRVRVMDTQRFGLYILHICKGNRGDSSLHSLFSVGTTVTCEVDAQRRHEIIPNHTMTHALNFVLNSVLGEGVEQKGSLVSPEKLRFDFTSRNAIAPHLLSEIQQRVNTMIHNGLIVDTGSIPLALGKAIPGAQAVFGEVYPDPVRVVAIGATVSDIVASPSDPRWSDISIEFCGGLHLTNTKDARAFVVIEEGSVSRGIRRITALTGDTALVSLDRAKEIQHTFDEICISFERFGSFLHQKQEDLDNIGQQVTVLQRALDNRDLPHVFKVKLRSDVEELQKRMSSLRNRINERVTDSGIATVVQSAADLAERGQHHGVFVLTGESYFDQKVLRRLTNELSRVAPSVSYFLILSNGSRLNCIAHVSSPSSPHQSQGSLSIATRPSLSAKEWVVGVLEGLGGKGGGKEESAQGSLGDASLLEEVREKATAYLQGQR